MRDRRSPRRMSGCMAILIVALAVAGFYLYESFQTAAPPTAIDEIPAPTVEIKTIPTGTPTSPPVTFKVVSEKARLTAPIVDLYFDNRGSWDLRFLGSSAGYLQGTRKIGQGGNFVLAGHVEMKDGSAGPFAHIHELKIGDPISIIQDSPDSPVLMQYTVTQVLTVNPNQLDVIRNHGFEELTLLTCREWDQNVNGYLTRVVVHARAVNKPASNAPTPRPLTLGS